MVPGGPGFGERGGQGDGCVRVCVLPDQELYFEDAEQLTTNGVAASVSVVSRKPPLHTVRRSSSEG
jgi:hypothetical protein